MPKYTAGRIEEIRGHLSELARRGIPVKEFAHELGVAEWTVHTWRRRFGPSTGALKGSPGVDLIEVTAPAPLPAIEIVIGDATVRVPSGVDAGDLERALRAVRAC